MEHLLRFLGENRLFLILLLAIAAAFFFLRSSPSQLADEAAFDSVLIDGQPTIVEFFSNY